MKEAQQDMNPDVQAALRALQRAAKQARKTAIQTNTGIVIAKNGKLTRVSAKELVAAEKRKR